MKDLKVNTDPAFSQVFEKYPDLIKEKLLRLRSLIIDTANGIEGITELEETLKWGEPSFLVKGGSTIRMDWKEKSPEQYAIYFKCTSKLIPTFKLAFKDTFRYEDSRAIIFDIDEVIPVGELRQCIKAALTYHKVKQLPTLGINKTRSEIS